MVDTIKFSEMTNAGNINNNDIVPSLRSSENVILNNPWVFLPSGTTAQRPAPSATINYRLRLNTDTQVYEYYNPILGTWIVLAQISTIPGPFLTYTADVSLPGAQNLGALSNGILKQTITTGIATLDIALQGTDYYGPGDTPTFAGMSLTGNLDMGGFTAINAAEPLNPQDYATKFYVDQNSLTGTSVYAASAATLGTVTQSGSGVGATITNAGVQAVFALDGVNPPVGTNVLIKDTATGMTSANEGIYTVLDIGSISTNWQIRRATSYDTVTEINNTGLINVKNGSTLAGTAWYNIATIVTVDATPFNYAEFGNIVFPITLPHGGTNANLTAAAGGVVFSTSTALAISAVGTSGQLFQSSGISAPGWTTTIYPVTNAINTIMYASSANVLGVITPVNNAVLISSAGGVPSMSTTLPTGIAATSMALTTPVIGGGTALSTYVEGTWTPIVTLTGGAGNTVPVYVTNSGVYTRIGNIVYCKILLSGDGGAEGAGTGQITITLPITGSALNDSNSQGVNGAGLNNATRYQLFTSISASVGFALIYYWSSVTAFTAMTGADQNNTTRNICLQFWYYV